jgi:hypothetical protein
MTMLALVTSSATANLQDVVSSVQAHGIAFDQVTLATNSACLKAEALGGGFDTILSVGKPGDHTVELLGVLAAALKPGGLLIVKKERVMEVGRGARRHTLPHAWGMPVGLAASGSGTVSSSASGRLQQGCCQHGRHKRGPGPALLRFWAARAWHAGAEWRCGLLLCSHSLQSVNSPTHTFFPECMSSLAAAAGCRTIQQVVYWWDPSVTQPLLSRPLPACSPRPWLP